MHISWYLRGLLLSDEAGNTPTDLIKNYTCNEKVKHLPAILIKSNWEDETKPHWNYITDKQLLGQCKIVLAVSASK